MISIQNVSKKYSNQKDFAAVNNLSFTAAQGKIMVLIGESGCGKTTLLKMINRLIEPTSGIISIENENILSLDPVILRRKIGYVFQGIGLFPHMSVAENISVVPKLLGWETIKIEKRVSELLEIISLQEDFKYRKISELSGGQQQRIGIARALAAGSKIILMDEPFGSLDPITRAGLIEEFQIIQNELNLTVILVTHDMLEGLTIADKIAIMRSGEIIGYGSPSELLNKPQHHYVKELLETPFKQTNKIKDILESRQDND